MGKPPPDADDEGGVECTAYARMGEALAGPSPPAPSAPAPGDAAAAPPTPPLARLARRAGAVLPKVEPLPWPAFGALSALCAAP